MLYTKEENKLKYDSHFWCRPVQSWGRPLDGALYTDQNEQEKNVSSIQGYPIEEAESRMQCTKADIFLMMLEVALNLEPRGNKVQTLFASAIILSTRMFLAGSVPSRRIFRQLTVLTKAANDGTSTKFDKVRYSFYLPFLFLIAHMYICIYIYIYQISPHGNSL